MSKHNTILSRNELLEIYRNLDNPKHDRDSVIEAAEQAVLSKLAEQEPVAWRFWLKDLQSWSYSSTHHGCGEPLYAHPMSCVSHTSDKTACVSEKAKNETQASSQVNLDDSNAPFTPRTPADMRKFIGNHFEILQYFNQETEEPDENDRYTLTIHDLISAFWWNGHFDYENFPIIREKSSKLNHVHESLVSTFAIKNGFKPKADGSVDERLYSFTNEIVGHVVGMMDSLVKTDHIPDTGKMVFDPDAALTLAERTLNIEITEPLAEEILQFARKLHEKYAQADHIPDASNMTWCACGDGYPEDSYQAGFIEGRGFCENCNAGEQTNDLKTSEARIINEANRYADVRVASALGILKNGPIDQPLKSLKLRIAAELMITKESASEVPEGWHLVPKEIDPVLLAPFNDCPEDELPLAWQALLMITPKFREKNNGN